MKRQAPAKISHLFNTTAWEAGMCSSPYLAPLLDYLPLMLLYYKTPHRGRAFCLLLRALSPSVLPSSDPRLPFMFP